MKPTHRIHIWLVSVAVALTALVSNASSQPSEQLPVLLAQGNSDCYAIGQRIAAENGGTLAKATAESSGGQTVCRIVVLVPGQGGERPRRREFTVPLR